MLFFVSSEVKIVNVLWGERGQFPARLGVQQMRARLRPSFVLTESRAPQDLKLPLLLRSLSCNTGCSRIDVQATIRAGGCGLQRVVEQKSRPSIFKKSQGAESTASGDDITSLCFNHKVPFGSLDSDMFFLFLFLQLSFTNEGVEGTKEHLWF